MGSYEGSVYGQQDWFKEAVIYQIYPSSFGDSNGDGIGDLRGIMDKIPHLKSLGVDVVWLSPVYKSPQNDMGYDVADYYQIDPRYGTMDDWDNLKKALDKAEIKILMDLVVNHTSDQHQWFLDSKSSKQHTRRSWYHWHAGRRDENGQRLPPNNWRSFFGKESAWEYDQVTDEYYLRLFTKEQPDLNWENPEVRKAVQNVVSFWLEKGVDGFRVDAINYICKAEGYPDAEVTDLQSPWQKAESLYMNRGNVHKYLNELNETTLSRYNVMTVGETPIVDNMDQALQYVHPGRKELNMVFSWEHMDIDRDPESILASKKWRLQDFKNITAKWQTFMHEKGGWNAVYLENHDQGRSISRFGNDSPEYRTRSGKMLALFQATLGGTLYIYQGQEIGMIDVPHSWGIEDYFDVVTDMYYTGEKQKRVNATGQTDPPMEDVLKHIRLRGRDNGRTPMQWNPGRNAGFSNAKKTWAPLNPDYVNCNVESCVHDPDSILHFWTKMLQIRSQWSTLVHGDFESLFSEHGSVFAYIRKFAGYPSALVLLNFSSNTVADLPVNTHAKLVLSNYKDTAALLQDIATLKPWEGSLFEIVEKS